MVAQRSSEARATTLGTRIMLLIASVLVLLVGIQLFVLTEFTERLFAWTIDVPLTAAFLGAAYWSSCVMEFVASRRRRWVDARIAIPPVLIFTAVTLLVTLVHLDVFHLDVPSVMTRFLTWSWLFVYAVVPPVMLVLLVRQIRAPGQDPPRRWLLPGWFRAALGVHAAVLIPMGLFLLLAPSVAGGWWPWALTPLTGRAIGAWLLGLGIAAAQVIGENDWLRIRPATMSYAVFAVLEFVAVARYADDVSWSTPAAWIYLLFLASSLGIGVYGWWRATQCSRAITVNAGMET
jgi:uncharacterized integral membrane protein